MIIISNNLAVIVMSIFLSIFYEWVGLKFHHIYAYIFFNFLNIVL